MAPDGSLVRSVNAGYFIGALVGALKMQQVHGRGRVDGTKTPFCCQLRLLANKQQVPGITQVPANLGGRLD